MAARADIPGGRTLPAAEETAKAGMALGAEVQSDRVVVGRAMAAAVSVALGQGRQGGACGRPDWMGP